MDLSVIIPTHYRLQSLKRLMDSIDKQECGNFDFEVIIVGNEIMDPVFNQNFQSEKLKSKVLCSGKLGVNAARNLGVKQAQGEILFLIDDDCVMADSFYLKKILDAHCRHKEVTAIGGMYETSSDASPINKAYSVISHSWQKPQYWGELRTVNLIGGNVSYKKNHIINSQHLFNEEITYGGTEFEFHSRLEESGYQLILQENLKILHLTELKDEDLKLKAQKQAMAQGRFKLKSGFSDYKNKSYHDESTLLALEVTKSREEFLEVLRFIEMFRKAFVKQIQRDLKEIVKIDGRKSLHERMKDNNGSY